ncbi:hypothetical protein CMQ_7552 [Grosmannia clavigera kw1407]|uniref:RNase MRP protein 1 RNA binding domain-containing protein n=1 Tax=Grosmannia clavigera (strain kw1407 / UAMH 11150) TaxID=655863 RepID=F0XPN7_GROCL|nr:uncharacterized protein CMQ_7552 [Grosmannia clavigera kw1407]EFX00550.1 hypothetical protein CMQ_7552 [Grosmannia clavigera kw1407]
MATTPAATTAVPVAAASPAESLEAALGMIAGFQHRHKNQHRLSAYWWAPFQQLRRHAEKLREELHAQQQLQQKKQQQKRPSRKRDVVSDAPTQRARWMQSNLVPKAYLAFSRLVVDKQFAPLGLLLLAVLAQIRAVLVFVIHEDEPTAAESRESRESQESQKLPADQGRAATGTREKRRAGDGNDDLGEAVTRAAQKPTIEAARQPRQPEGNEEHGSINTTKADRKEKDKKKEKQRKRKRGGDEFDNLFSGLL